MGGNVGGTFKVKDATIHFVEAVHSSSYAADEKSPSQYAGAPMGFVIQIDNGPTLYHGGDTGLFGGMSLIGERFKPTYALLPIGGHFTLDPAGAAQAARLLGNPTVVPMHYGTFPLLAGTPDKLEAELKKAKSKAKVNRWRLARPPRCSPQASGAARKRRFRTPAAGPASPGVGPLAPGRRVGYFRAGRLVRQLGWISDGSRQGGLALLVARGVGRGPCARAGPVVPPGLPESSSGRARARAYLRRMLRASGLLYGTPADGGVPRSTPGSLDGRSRGAALPRGGADLGAHGPGHRAAGRRARGPPPRAAAAALRRPHRPARRGRGHRGEAAPGARGSEAAVGQGGGRAGAPRPLAVGRPGVWAGAAQRGPLRRRAHVRPAGARLLLRGALNRDDGPAPHRLRRPAEGAPGGGAHGAGLRGPAAHASPRAAPSSGRWRTWGCRTRSRASCAPR